MGLTEELAGSIAETNEDLKRALEIRQLCHRGAPKAGHVDHHGRDILLQPNLVSWLEQ